MTLFQALLLGILQGVTEFLPISSSGHLVLLQHIFGLREPELAFDVFVHVATLLAVVVVYRRDVWALLVACPGIPASLRPQLPRESKELVLYRRLGLFVLLANVPTALIGLYVATAFEHLFAAPWAVGVALLASGVLLWSLKSQMTGSRGLENLGVKHAFILGVVQGLAVIPGLSRSGSTIVAALWCGMQRQEAARFSFLMALPAILGAAVLESRKLDLALGPSLSVLLIGMSGALLVGYIALRFLLRLLSQGQLWRFAFYCWVIGLGAIGYSLLA